MNTQGFLAKSLSDQIGYLSDFPVVVLTIVQSDNLNSLELLKSSLNEVINTPSSPNPDDVFTLNSLEGKYRTIEFWQNELNNFNYSDVLSIKNSLLRLFNNIFPDLPTGYADFESLRLYCEANKDTDFGLIEDSFCMVSSMILNGVDSQKKIQKEVLKANIMCVITLIIVLLLVGAILWWYFNPI